MSLEGDLRRLFQRHGIQIRRLNFQVNDDGRPQWTITAMTEKDLQNTPQENIRDAFQEAREEGGLAPPRRSAGGSDARAGGNDGSTGTMDQG